MKDEIIVVGMGPGPVKYLTQEARDLLLATEQVYFRFSGHPVYRWLREQGKECLCFDFLTEIARDALGAKDERAELHLGAARFANVGVEPERVFHQSSP
jgi:uncharacterized protein YabN with tetrapyrrole methylase and pyrophosphatase domain